MANGAIAEFTFNYLTNGTTDLVFDAAGAVVEDVAFNPILVESVIKGSEAGGATGAQGRNYKSSSSKPSSKSSSSSSS